MQKKGLLLSMLILTNSALATSMAPEPLDETVVMSQNSKVTQFLANENSKLSSDFAYRINLPKVGQIAKNNAGIRIAETANQLAADTTGLLFYYNLVTHAMRVPHWHANAAEVGVVLNGKMRVTIWEGQGKPHIFTVEKNGTWTIPPATLHCLENVGNTPLNFIVAYNSPIAADRDFATAWAALPDAMLEKSLGISKEEIANIRKTTINRLSKYDPAGTLEKPNVVSPFGGSFSKAKPIYNGALGTIQRVDASNTARMTAMSLQHTVLKPNAMRQPHWYLEADTLLFVHKGAAFFTMMDNDGKIYNAIIKPGDVVYIPMGVFHSYVNISAGDLEIYETFESTKPISEISLLNGAQNMNPQVLAGATGISVATAQHITQNKTDSTYITAF